MNHIQYLVACLVAILLASSARASVTINEYSRAVTVDFRGTDGPTILREVARAMGMSIEIPSDFPSDKHTIKLSGVNFRVIFRTIISPNGYDYLTTESGFRIMRPEDIEALPDSNLNIELYYQIPEDVIRHLTRTDPQWVKKSTFEGFVLRLTVPAKFSTYVRYEVDRVDNIQVRINPFIREPYLPDTFPDFRDASGKFVLRDRALPEEGSEKEVLEAFLARWVDPALIISKLRREFGDRVRLQASGAQALVIGGPSKEVLQAMATAEYLDDKRWYDPSAAKRAIAKMPEKTPEPTPTAVTAPAQQEP